MSENSLGPSGCGNRHRDVHRIVILANAGIYPRRSENTARPMGVLNIAH